MSPKYPEIVVKLVDEDGNAFAIMGRVSSAMRRAGVSSEARNEFLAEATAGNYDDLLQTVMRWVTVD